MDRRRLNSRDIMAMDLLNMRPPNIGEPEDREFEKVEYSERESRLIELLESNKVVSCPEYYGIPKMWRTDAGQYHCVLVQYRNITEEHDYATAEEAAAWFRETAIAVMG